MTPTHVTIIMLLIDTGPVWRGRDTWGFMVEDTVGSKERCKRIVTVVPVHLVAIVVHKLG